MTTIPRYLLEKFFASEPRLLRAFEEQARAIGDNSTAVTATVASTKALQDATVLVLSANDALANERILRFGPGLNFDDDGTYLTISAQGVVLAQDYAVTMVAPADVILFLPPQGTLATRELAETLANKTLAAPSLAGVGNYASDSAAATGGVAVGGIYHTAGTLKVRLT